MLAKKTGSGRLEQLPSGRGIAAVAARPEPGKTFIEAGLAQGPARIKPATLRPGAWCGPVPPTPYCQGKFFLSPMNGNRSLLLATSALSSGASAIKIPSAVPQSSTTFPSGS